MIQYHGLWFPRRSHNPVEKNQEGHRRFESRCSLNTGRIFGSERCSVNEIRSLNSGDEDGVGCSLMGLGVPYQT